MQFKSSKHSWQKSFLPGNVSGRGRCAMVKATCSSGYVDDKNAPTATLSVFLVLP
jgi:hypothetical protein